MGSYPYSDNREHDITRFFDYFFFARLDKPVFIADILPDLCG